MTSLFSSNYHNKLKKNVEQTYLDFIDDVQNDLDEGYKTDFLSASFMRELKSFMGSQELKEFSPLHLHWGHSLDQIIQIVQLHEERQELLDAQDNDEVEIIDEEIFQFWDQHEYSHLFVEIIQKGKEATSASLELIPLLENQLLSYYKLHLTTDPFISDRPLLYQAIPEKGDGDYGLYIGNTHQFCELDVQELDGLVPFSRVDHQQKFIEVQVSEEKIFLADFKEVAHKVCTDDISLSYLPICKLGQDQASLQTQRIQNALEKIQKFSPDSFQTLHSFTHSIVPVNDPGIVSFSVQSLPGYSSINLFERDDIDLLDDLLHENGHHYLNAFLNHEEHIQEDPEQIYYSPWRRALRPIRGIYHAYFTFYWALKLFRDISSHKDFTSAFSNDEQAKILLRACEEYEMLSFCTPLLEWANESGQIEPAGLELFKSTHKNIESFKDNVLVLEKNLQDTHPQKYKELTELKEHLVEMKEQYHSDL